MSMAKVLIALFILALLLMFFGVRVESLAF